MRLGLASRGNTDLNSDAVVEAVRRGVNYLNWCGYPDGLRDAVRQIGEGRKNIFVAVQLSARTAAAARVELHEVLGELGTDYLDVVTYYYVEHEDEWQQIRSPGGAAEVVDRAKSEGIVRSIGLTSHRRELIAEIASRGSLDLAMPRAFIYHSLGSFLSCLLECIYIQDHLFTAHIKCHL